MSFGKNYFEKVFKHEDPWGYTLSRYETVKYSRQVGAIKRHRPQPGKILEVGCAEGMHSVMMAEAFPEARIYSIDISQLAIDRARKNCKPYSNIELIEADVVELLKRGALEEKGFDVIVQSESLYYLFPSLLSHMQLGSYIRRLTGRLKSQGIFVTANGINPQTWLCMQIYYNLLGRFCKPVHSAVYREWHELHSKFITYDVRVFRNGF